MGSTNEGGARLRADEIWRSVSAVALRAMGVGVVALLVWTGGPTTAGALAPDGDSDLAVTSSADEDPQNPGDGGEPTDPEPVEPEPVLPDAPSGVSLGAGDASLTVSWAPTTGAEVEHEIEVAGPGGATVRVEAGLTSATVAGLTNGAPYVVRVRAIAADGASTWVDAGVATPAGLSGAPVLEQAVPQDGEIALSWTAPLHDGGRPVESYQVEVSRDGTVWPDVTVAGATTYVVPDLTNGLAYTVRVRATTAMGAGEWSAAVTVTPQTVPGKPWVSATPGKNQVTVRWERPTITGGAEITRYEVQRWVDGAWAPGVTVSSSTRSFVRTGLPNGVQQKFRVLVYNAAGRTASLTVAATPRTVPSAPKVTTKPGSGRVTLTWAAPSNGGAAITAYEVQRWVNGAWAPGVTVSSSTRSFVRTGLPNGVQQKFRVLAYNAAGRTASVTVSATPRTVPSAPRVSAKPGAGRATVTWAAPSNGGATITSYVVQRYVNGRWTPGVTVSASARSYVLTGLPNGVLQKFRVLARNAAGTGKASATADVRPRTTPSAPRVSGKAGSGRVTVSWAAPSNGGAAITSYVVQRYSAGAWRTVATVSASARSHTVTGLPNGVLQKFRVLARNAAGTGKPSATVSARPKAPAAPKPPATPRCHSAYSPCLPVVSDLNCPDIRELVRVRNPGVDPYRLDADDDGWGCESYG